MKKTNKKILVLFYRPPSPVRKGDQVILQKRLKAFSLVGNVTLLTYGKKLADDEKTELEKYCSDFHFVNFSFFCALVGLIKNTFTKIPFQVALYSNKNYKKKLIGLLERNYDVIHFVGLRSTYYHNLVDTKSIDFIDSMYLNFCKRIENNKKYLFIKNIIFKIEKKRLLVYENHLSAICKKSFVIASRDQKYIKGSVIIHGSVDQNKFTPIEKKFSWTLCFTGNLNYVFNEEALVWFYDVFIELIKRHPMLKFNIIGVGRPSIITKYMKLSNVKIISNPKNMANEVNKTDIFVSPLQTATGMQNKILEAMACGKPVVMTKPSVGDLKIKNLVNAMIANDKNDFIKKVEFLLLNNEVRCNLSKMSRVLIENYYSDDISNVVFLEKLGLKCNFKGAMNG